MPVSADTLSPAGINWETAMSNAAQVLEFMKDKRGVGQIGYAHAAAVAQAWIAYAREITMHARAVQ